MLYLLDTSAVSDLMNGNPVIDKNRSKVPSNDVIATCTIVRGEIKYGIERLSSGKRKNGLMASAQKIFDSVPCHPITADVGDFYSQIKYAAELAGQPVAENDLWIAATCLALGATLITRDSDFSKISEKTIDWTSE